MSWCRCLLGSCLFFATAQNSLAAWEDWWRTPEQQAMHAFEEGNHEALIEQAPDAGWTGLGQFQSGDYDAATQSFAESARQRQREGDLRAANRARYNQGVSDVKAGRYQQAIEQFDGVLESDPAFADAAHNRNIAQQLMQLQEQQQQQGNGRGDGDGEQSPDPSGDASSDESDNGESGSESNAEQAGQQSGQQSGQQGDQQDGQSQRNEAESQAGDGGQTRQQEGQSDRNSDSDSMSEQSAEQQARDEEQARQALAAEAQRQTKESDESDANQDESTASVTSADGERPLSESEQATEQLLRRIPDDPAGLLRRKLEQSHRSEYPEVRDATQPW